MSLCQYKNIFGDPNSGVHSIRIFDIAVVDLLATLLLSAIIYKFYFKARFNLSRKSMGLFSAIFIALMIVAISLHRLFCVNTKLNVLLFGEV